MNPMRMAKPSDKELDLAAEFVEGLVSIFQHRVHPDTGKAMTGVEILDWIEHKFGSVSLSRVYWAGRTAIENTCDPSLDYLDYKPEIKAAIESAVRITEGA